jgi:hypothetical protein
VNDSRNITKNCQEDVDQKVGATATLDIVVSFALDGQGDRVFLTSRKTPRGGRMMARMILQMSLVEVSFWWWKWRFQRSRHGARMWKSSYLAWKAIVKWICTGTETDICSIQKSEGLRLRWN